MRERFACSCLTALAPEHSFSWHTLLLIAPAPGAVFSRLVVVLPSVISNPGNRGACRWPQVLRWPESSLPPAPSDLGLSAIRPPVRLLGSRARGARCSTLLPLDVHFFRSCVPFPLPLPDVLGVCSHMLPGLTTLCRWWGLCDPWLGAPTRSRQGFTLLGFLASFAFSARVLSVSLLEAPVFVSFLPRLFPLRGHFASGLSFFALRGVRP